MGGPAGGLASVDDTEWLSEVRAGRKKAAVLRDAEKVFQVCSHSTTSLRHRLCVINPVAVTSQGARLIQLS